MGLELCTVVVECNVVVAKTVSVGPDIDEKGALLLGVLVGKVNVGRGVHVEEVVGVVVCVVEVPRIEVSS